MRVMSLKMGSLKVYSNWEDALLYYTHCYQEDAIELQRRMSHPPTHGHIPERYPRTPRIGIRCRPTTIFSNTPAGTTRMASGRSHGPSLSLPAHLLPHSESADMPGYPHAYSEPSSPLVPAPITVADHRHRIGDDGEENC
jgi:hypothetical protein